MDYAICNPNSSGLSYSQPWQQWNIIPATPAVMEYTIHNPDSNGLYYLQPQQ